MATDSGSGATTLHVHMEIRDRLKELKPYESMSFNELLDDMCDQYSPEE